MNVRVVFQGFQVSHNLGGNSQFGGEPLLQNCREAVSLANRSQTREQQMHFDDLPVSRGAKTNPVILNAQFRANYVESVADISPCCRVGIIQEPDS